MSKLISLREAVDTYIPDGSLVYLAGFTHLIPFAVGHEMIRQGKKHVVIARATPDLITDQLVAAGCVHKLIFSYMGNPGVGSLRVTRAAIEQGKLAWEEYSHFGMISRLKAGASGLPFMPMNPTAAGDLARANPKYRTLIDPYTGKEVVAVPPLHPDVAVIHVQRADEKGNAQVWGIIGEQKEVSFASQRVIVTAEEIVDNDLIRSDPNRTLIPEIVVDAVCHIPYCAHPSYTQGYYDRDNDFYLEWDEISKSDKGVAAYLEEWVYGVEDRNEYWDKLGKEKKDHLRTESRITEGVDYGRY